jgi:hypothetical protein
LKKNNTYTKGQRTKGNKNKNRGSNWKKKQNKLGLKVEIKKKIVIKGSIKTIRNKKIKTKLKSIIYYELELKD